MYRYQSIILVHMPLCIFGSILSFLQTLYFYCCVCRVFYKRMHSLIGGTSDDLLFPDIVTFVKSHKVVFGTLNLIFLSSHSTVHLIYVL